MKRKRLWEAGAVATLLLALTVVVTSYWQSRQLNDRLALAMSRNDGNTVRLLVDRGGLVTTRDTVRRTVLTWAAVFGDLPLMGDALRRGANVNDRAQGDMTALMWAAMAGHADAVEMLLAAGAEVNARDAHGRTALSWAADTLGGQRPQARKAVMAALRRAGATR